MFALIAFLCDVNLHNGIQRLSAGKNLHEQTLGGIEGEGKAEEKEEMNLQDLWSD